MCKLNILAFLHFGVAPDAAVTAGLGRRPSKKAPLLLQSTVTETEEELLEEEDAFDSM